MHKFNHFEHGARLLAVGAVLSAALGAETSRAQVTIDVIASQQRDGIDVEFTRTGAGIAADGAIAFSANTSTLSKELFLAETGSAQDLGAWANSDVQINSDSIVFIGNGVRALSRTNATGAVSTLLACGSGTPCPVSLSLTDNGRVAFSAMDGAVGIYLGQVSNGAASATLATIPKPPAFISILGVDVDAAGALLLRGDYQASKEVYGAFRWRAATQSYDTIFSTRDGPNAGNGGAYAAKLGSLGQSFVLVPEQLSLTGVRDLEPGIYTSPGVPYGTLSAFGTRVLALLSVSGGSMEINEAGLALVVAQLSSGWSGLFSLDTSTANPSAVPLVALNASLGSCQETLLKANVLGVNAVGQSVVKAQVQTPGGIDNQLWRVTPSPTFSISYCHLALIPLRPFEREYFPWREPLPYKVYLPPLTRPLPIGPGLP